MNEDFPEDDPFVAALLSPGTSAELAGEADALAAFRAAQGGRRRGHLRLITGTGAVVVTLALSGGVAAAYTGHLPQPLQSAAHSLLGPLSVPAPTRHITAAPRRHPAPPLPTPSPMPRHGTPAAPVTIVSTPHPTASPSAAAAPTPTAAPSPSATVAPTASPSPAPKPDITSSVSATSVPVHQTVELRGLISRDGKPLAGRTLYASEQVIGGQSWHRVGNAKSGSNGRVAITIPALTSNVRLRLVTSGGAVSPVRAVTVRPKVKVKLTEPSSTSYAVAVTTDGANEGDTATLLRYDGSQWVTVTSKKLTAGGKTRFTVNHPSSDRRFRVRISATSTHGIGVVAFTAKA